MVTVVPRIPNESLRIFNNLLTEMLILVISHLDWFYCFAWKPHHFSESLMHLRIFQVKDGAGKEADVKKTKATPVTSKTRLAAAVARDIYQTDGVRGFYRGYIASLFTYVPSSALWWSFYHLYQGELLPSIGIDMLQSFKIAAKWKLNENSETISLGSPYCCYCLSCHEKIPKESWKITFS